MTGSCKQLLACEDSEKETTEQSVTSSGAPLRRLLAGGGSQGSATLCRATTAKIEFFSPKMLSRGTDALMSFGSLGRGRRCSGIAASLRPREELLRQSTFVTRPRSFQPSKVCSEIVTEDSNLPADAVHPRRHESQEMLKHLFFHLNVIENTHKMSFVPLFFYYVGAQEVSCFISAAQTGCNLLFISTAKFDLVFIVI